MMKKNLLFIYFSKKNDKFECYANELKCVRAALDRCGAIELERLQQATDNNEPMVIDNFIKNKLVDDIEMYMEYDEWNNGNNVPEALKEIIHSLSQAQKRLLSLKTKSKKIFEIQIIFNY